MENKISEIARPVIEDLGFALVQVRVNGEGVLIMAEDPQTQNLGVDDCAKISRALSAALDVEDPIKGAYRLEVSSPGIDRPLVRLADFEKYTGFEAKLESTLPLPSGQKKFRGILKGLENEVIQIETEQGLAQIPFSTLAKAKLVLTDELLKAKTTT